VTVMWATYQEFVKHGKDWASIMMVYFMGVYWGFYKVDAVAGYYGEYVKGMDALGETVSSQSQAAILVLTQSYVSFLILCFLIVACGIFFGFMTIVLVAIQGMYMGFWLYWINGAGNQLNWDMMIMIGITEFVQVIFVISAGALGLRLGNILIITIYQIITRKPVQFRGAFNSWWNQSLRYALLAMFIVGCNALIKAGMVFWL
jgi:hypothetical protein